MSKTKLLMCKPNFFDVSYYINPWMRESGIVDTNLANKQYSNLLEILYKEADIQFIRPINKLPDMVFTANSALVIDENIVILPTFRNKERKPETKHYNKYFKDNGFSTLEFGKNCYFEGAGDALWSGESLFVGHGFRSNLKSADLISNLLPNVEVSILKLVDPNFYHLDTCFCPIGNNWCIVYPDAFDKESYDIIAENNFCIELSKEEAELFCGNSVVIGNKIIMNKTTESLSDILNDINYEVIECDLSEFMKSGGSAKCLTLKLNNFKE